MEDGAVLVSRAKGTLRFPARFILIAAMNPCPCGYFGSDHRRCRCSPAQIERYISKISGPLLDRIDIHCEVAPVSFHRLRSGPDGTPSEQIRKQVVSARQIQSARFGQDGLVTNSTMTHKDVQKFCKMDESCQQLLKQAMTEFGLSARAHDKICKVARTIADLEQSESIRPEHIAEAIGYRKLDRKL
jgi:magnesium chelatase family protein